MSKLLCNSLSSFLERFEELRTFAQELITKYGKEDVSKIRVVFWAKDGDGTPCLVEGAYNYWSGDEEILLSDIAEGVNPDYFINRLERYVDREPYFVAEYAAEAIADGLTKDYYLDLNWSDIKDILWKPGSLDLNYDALYDALDTAFEDENRISFINMLHDKYEEEHDLSFLEYGWEYYLIDELSIIPIPEKIEHDPIFGEVIGSHWTENIREWDGAHDREEIKKERLETLISEIRKHK